MSENLKPNDPPKNEYVYGILGIAETFGLSIKDAGEIALADIQEKGALEHVELTEKAIAWIKKQQLTGNSH